MCWFCRLSTGFIYDFASSASKKLSLTAQTIKKSVEEGKFDGIIDKVLHCIIIHLICPHYIH